MHVYCKTFYWTLLNYFQVYRSLGTGMVNASDDAKITEDQAKVERNAGYAAKIFEKVGQAGKEIAKTIPFAGTAIAAIESIVGICWDYYKEESYQARVDAINLIIKEKISTEDDISAIVGKLAIQVTYSRELEICDNKQDRDSKLQASFNYIMDKIDSVKGQIIKSPDLNSSEAAQLAIRDVSLILTYCYKNFDEIVDMEEELDILFKEIIGNGLSRIRQSRQNDSH